MDVDSNCSSAFKTVLLWGSQFLFLFLFGLVFQLQNGNCNHCLFREILEMNLSLKALSCLPQSHK